MKLNYAMTIVVFLSVAGSVARGQSLSSGSSHEVPYAFSGDLRLDLEQAISLSPLRPDSLEIDKQKKSGLIAGAMSLALPGAGELYVGEYWKAASFLAAEAGLWIIYAAYETKGDDQTRLFESYADDYWSVVKYAQWVEQYGLALNPDADPAKLSNLYNQSNPSAPPWERVYWDRLNNAEIEIGKRTGTFFSHQLPIRPEQQYYELIGKYPQFNPGWADANVDNTNFHTALTQRFLDYSKMRGEANDFYNIASTATKLLVLNHILSALDAAWSASNHNKRVTMEAHIVPVNRPFGIVEFVPTARVQIGL
jgi:hypothetical protein